MIARLLLAGMCLWIAPVDEPKACDELRAQETCECLEYVHWRHDCVEPELCDDAGSYSRAYRRDLTYHILRLNVDSGEQVEVGSFPALREVWRWTDPLGETRRVRRVPADLLWMPALDDPLPTLDVLYQYRVRSCHTHYGCRTSDNFSWYRSPLYEVLP